MKHYFLRNKKGKLMLIAANSYEDAKTMVKNELHIEAESLYDLFPKYDEHDILIEVMFTPESEQFLHNFKFERLQ